MICTFAFVAAVSAFIALFCTRPAERRYKKDVFYVAHPVSGDVLANVANVIAWIRWLTLHDPTRVYIAPWVAEVQAFEKDGADLDAAFYARVLADDCDVVRHLDGIILVGGKVSCGMALELAAARDEDLTVVDLSPLTSPPGDHDPTGTRLVQAMIEQRLAG